MDAIKSQSITAVWADIGNIDLSKNEDTVPKARPMPILPVNLYMKKKCLPLGRCSLCWGWSMITARTPTRASWCGQGLGCGRRVADAAPILPWCGFPVVLGAM